MIGSEQINANWSSSNNNVASVSNGVVTISKFGTATTKVEIKGTFLYEAFVWWISFALLHILKRWIKEDSTRVSIATLFYVVVRMFLLEGLYEGTQFMGSITARIIYCIIILICITIIIVNYLKNRKLKNV